MRLYHGTWAGNLPGIILRGLKPQENDSWVYLTSDWARAEHYAKVWTGGILHRRPDALAEGIILRYDLPALRDWVIEPDEYSPEEPGQWRLRHAHVHLLRLQEIERLSYAHLSPEERLRLACVLIGVASR